MMTDAPGAELKSGCQVKRAPAEDHFPDDTPVPVDLTAEPARKINAGFTLVRNQRPPVLMADIAPLNSTSDLLTPFSFQLKVRPQSVANRPENLAASG
jgi:hypothetical protein